MSNYTDLQRADWMAAFRPSITWRGTRARVEFHQDGDRWAYGETLREALDHGLAWTERHNVSGNVSSGFAHDAATSYLNRIEELRVRVEYERGEDGGLVWYFYGSDTDQPVGRKASFDYTLAMSLTLTGAALTNMAGKGN